MLDITNYYSNLFNLNISVFSVTFGIILVFLQIAHAQYSVEYLKFLVRDKAIRFYFLTSLLAVVLTAFLYFISAFQISFTVSKVESLWFISRPLIALIPIVLLLVNLAIFVFVLVVRNIQNLLPSKAILITISQIKTNDIRDFIWKKYGIDKPFPRYHLLDDLEKGEITVKTDDDPVKKAESVIEKELKRLQDKDYTDPLNYFSVLVKNAIRSHNIELLETTLRELTELTTKFVTEYKKKLKPKQWTKYDKIISQFSELLIVHYDQLLELADIDGSMLASTTITKHSGEIANIFIKHEQYGAFDNILEFWRSRAEKEIKQGESVLVNSLFDCITKSGLLLGKEFAEGEPEKVKNIFDNVLRMPGVLGEILLSDRDPDNPRLIQIYSTNSNYQRLLSMVYEFAEIYRKSPQAYPLIFFDSILVLVQKLIDKQKNDYKQDVEDRLFNMIYDIYQFAEGAIQAGNIDGTRLAITRYLIPFCNDFDKKGLEISRNDTAKLINKLGVLVYDANKKGGKFVDFGNKKLDEVIIGFVSQHHYIRAVRDEMQELIIKTDVYDHDSAWEYIVKVGMIVGDNFGLMFDPMTGEMLSE